MTLLQSTSPDSLAVALSEGFLGLASPTWEKVFLSLATVFGAWLAERIAVRIISRSFEERSHQYRLRKGVSYSLSAIALLFIGTIWIDGLRQVGTFLGLLSAGLAIALKDLVADLAGWVYLLWKAPFSVEDRIQIGEHSGDVVDISILQFSLIEIGNWVDADQSTGRIIHIPNAQILSQPLANYTMEFPFVWHEIPVLVTFESDWRRAKEVLAEIVEDETRDVSNAAREALRRAPGKMLISYRKLSPTIYTSVRDAGILLTLRLLVQPKTRRGVEHRIWERVLDAFAADPALEFAYPTRRIYRSPTDVAGDAVQAEIVQGLKRAVADRGSDG
jgi:small-conductance mechanosensitive channel